jgi:hypothetical protein
LFGAAKIRVVFDKGPFERAVEDISSGKPQSFLEVLRCFGFDTELTVGIPHQDILERLGQHAVKRGKDCFVKLMPQSIVIPCLSEAVRSVEPKHRQSVSARFLELGREDAGVGQ